jgi:hypothetical protein
MVIADKLEARIGDAQVEGGGRVFSNMLEARIGDAKIEGGGRGAQIEGGGMSALTGNRVTPQIKGGSRDAKIEREASGGPKAENGSGKFDQPAEGVRGGGATTAESVGGGGATPEKIEGFSFQGPEISDEKILDANVCFMCPEVEDEEIEDAKVEDAGAGAGATDVRFFFSTGGTCAVEGEGMKGLQAA